MPRVPREILALTERKVIPVLREQRVPWDNGVAWVQRGLTERPETLVKPAILVQQVPKALREIRETQEIRETPAIQETQVRRETRVHGAPRAKTALTDHVVALDRRDVVRQVQTDQRVLRASRARQGAPPIRAPRDHRAM